MMGIMEVIGVIYISAVVISFGKIFRLLMKKYKDL